MHAKNNQLQAYEARLRNQGALANEKAIRRGDNAMRAIENNDIEATTNVMAKSGVGGKGMSAQRLKRDYEEYGIETPISGDALARATKGDKPVFDEGK